MSVLVVGLSHRSAPLPILERTAVSGEALTKLLLDVQAEPNVAESLVVSTCNRVEIYAEVDRFHGALSAITGLIAMHSGIPIEQLTRHLYVHYEDRAVQHLFSMVCGLDSMVTGEGQILGQVRLALKLAQQEQTAGRYLGGLFQQALRVGKRAHSETGIDKAGVSLVSVGLDLAEKVMGPISEQRALVVGAGAMSALAATTLSRTTGADDGAADIVIANRTHERGVRLAESVGGRAIELSTLERELADADLVVSCTGSTSLVVTADMLAGRTKPLFLLDLALPHDVDPGVRAIPGVTLVDLESLQNAPQTGEFGKHASRSGEIDAVRRIVADEVTEFLRTARAERVTPTVVALRSKAADVVEAELGRLSTRLPAMDEQAKGEIAQTVRRVVDKLLHEPTVRVKRLAATADGDHYAEALRELFDLDQRAPEAIAQLDDQGEPT